MTGYYFIVISVWLVQYVLFGMKLEQYKFMTPVLFSTYGVIQTWILIGILLELTKELGA